MTQSLKGVVSEVLKGHRGDYAIATAVGVEGSITFSLSPDVWKEKAHPAKKDRVFLSDLRQTRNGWRAFNTRFWQPSDEPSKQPKQQKQRKRAHGQETQ